MPKARIRTLQLLHFFPKYWSSPITLLQPNLGDPKFFFLKPSVKQENSVRTEHDLFDLVSLIHFSSDLDPKVNVPKLSLPHLSQAVEPSKEQNGSQNKIISQDHTEICTPVYH